jgi:alpha/beta superfamily hydrolase
LLAGCLPDDPFGANGVALGEGNLYAANTGKGILVSIPILTDGSAGEPEIVAGVGDCDAEVKDMYGMDGIALDAEGNVYALLVLQNKLVKIDPADGSFTILLTEDDGIHNPASIVFGVGEGNQESILFTNYAVLPPEPPASPGSAVLRLDVGVPGLPIPAASAAMSPAPAQETKTEGIEVAYEDTVIRGTMVGEGDMAVVLAPMFHTPRSSWMPFAEHLASQGFAALAFDFPGPLFGALSGEFRWSLTGSYVGAVIDFLHERGYERIVCMGASLGAWGCFEAVLVRPDLAGLAIISDPLTATTSEEAAVLLMPKLFVRGNEADDVVNAMRDAYRLVPRPKEFVILSAHAHGTSLFNSADKNEFRDLLVEFVEGLQ